MNDAEIAQGYPLNGSRVPRDNVKLFFAYF